MPAEAHVELRGLLETQRKMDQVMRDLRGPPFVNAMRDAVMVVTSAARRNAPVDRGLLRASITPAVRMQGDTVLGVVGSNVRYAPYMETGTGVFVGRPPHCPPPAALEGWARRHGTTGYQVARAICRRGGLRARKYLERAITENAGRIHRILQDFVGKTARK